MVIRECVEQALSRVEYCHGVCSLAFKESDYANLADYHETILDVYSRLIEMGYKVKVLYGRNIIGDLTMMKLRVSI